jgi:hypothetical protein
MRISLGITIVVALAVLVGVLLGGQALLQPNLPLITEADFSLDTITPNADGDSDVTEFSYGLSRNAQVSVVFESEDGQQYFFRKDQARIPDNYTVLFSGVVDGYTHPDEQVSGQVLRRLMPDGQYTWKLLAVDTATGEAAELTGILTIQSADSPLPELQNFSVSPDTFTPNQDGIDDHTQINVYLTKPSELTVYLEDQNGQQIYIPEFQGGRETGEEGRHQFDYDGGVTLGVEPPPDGTYTIYAVAQDAEGQITRQSAVLSVKTGGDPQAEIAPQPIGVDVIFAAAPYDEGYFSLDGLQGELVAMPDDPQDLNMNAVPMPVGDLLVFKLTVENYGNVPIRTSGPPPGTVYEQNQVAATLGWLDESGAWRVGIDCDTATRDYPWRWAIGSADELLAESDSSGNTYYYLPPGESSVVWGAIRMTDLNEARNPQNCWAGLIHEDVEVSLRNSRVGARSIELVDPSSAPGS